MDKMNLFGVQPELKNKLKDRVEPAFGIDLGTTNSAISCIINMNKPEPIRLVSGKYTMPSCVMWNGSQNGFIVGEEAYARIDEVEHVVYSIKRHMQDKNYKRTFTYNGESITMSPAEISAEILKGLIKQTNGMYGEIHDVVVTVPAYFNVTGREATIEACKLAGLNLLGLLVEPSSAALTYNLDKDEAKNIIVYDLGGGTFDISLIRLSTISEKEKSEFEDIYGFDDTEADEDEDVIENFETHYKVIDTEGDSCLGGDDYDLELYKILTNKLKEKGVDTQYLSESFKAKMTHALEYYKKTDVDSDYHIPIHTVLTDANKTEVNEKVVICASDFRQALLPTYNKTKKLLNSLIKKYGEQYKISDIVLVGGSTKSEILRYLIRKDFSKYRINCNAEPDLSVTLGAAIAAKTIKFGDDHIKIFDALSIAISIKEEELLVPIIPKASELPAKCRRLYTTVVDNQTSISIDLYQGNTTLPEEAAFLGNIEISGIKPRPAGEANIVVEISVDVNGILRCKAKIDDIMKDITLQLKSESSSEITHLGKDEKRVLRWKKAINKIKDTQKKAKLLVLLGKYPNEIDSKTIRKEIKDAFNIQEWTEYLDTVTLDDDKKVLKHMIYNYPEHYSESDVNDFISEIQQRES